MAWKRSDSVALGVLAIGAAATAAVYAKLPDPMATHFDLSGQPNGWMPRATGAWACPVIALGMWAALRYLPRVLPRSEKRRLGEPTAALVAALTTVFLMGVHGLVLRYALTGAGVTGAALFMVGVLYVALGLVLPRVRRNALVGVRTPWTLASDENWARTQRVGGYAMVLGGVAVALLGVVGTLPATLAAVVVLLASGAVPVVYSLILARRQDPG